MNKEESFRQLANEAISRLNHDAEHAFSAMGITEERAEELSEILKEKGFPGTKSQEIEMALEIGRDIIEVVYIVRFLDNVKARIKQDLKKLLGIAMDMGEE